MTAPTGRRASTGRPGAVIPPSPLPADTEPENGSGGPSRGADEGEWWERQGYVSGRRLTDRYEHYWLVVMKMVFTWRVAVCDTTTIYDFCCFEKLSDAQECWRTWDGSGLPPGPWTRHHGSGYRHIDGQLFHDDGLTPVPSKGESE